MLCFVPLVYHKCRLTTYNCYSLHSVIIFSFAKNLQIILDIRRYPRFFQRIEHSDLSNIHAIIEYQWSEFKLNCPEQQP